jgi:hypothetical protein
MDSGWTSRLPLNNEAGSPASARTKGRAAPAVAHTGAHTTAPGEAPPGSTNRNKNKAIRSTGAGSSTAGSTSSHGGNSRWNTITRRPTSSEYSIGASAWVRTPESRGWPAAGRAPRPWEEAGPQQQCPRREAGAVHLRAARVGGQIPVSTLRRPITCSDNYPPGVCPPLPPKQHHHFDSAAFFPLPSCCRSSRAEQRENAHRVRSARSGDRKTGAWPARSSSRNPGRLAQVSTWFTMNRATSSAEGLGRSIQTPGRYAGLS